MGKEDYPLGIGAFHSHSVSLFFSVSSPRNGLPTPFPLSPIYCLQSGLLSLLLEQTTQSFSYSPVLKVSIKSSSGFLRVPTISKRWRKLENG